MNGFSKTSLELLRLSIQLKQVKRKVKELEEKRIINSHEVASNLIKEKHKTVWVCWLQGKDNAPPIVAKCIESIENLEDKEVNFITSENLEDYVKFPKHIYDKWNSGIISNAHFSDLIRMELLYSHGGIWLDATVFLSSTHLPEFLENSWMFIYQPLKPGADGGSIRMSSWAMSSIQGNPILGLAREYLYNYWSEKDTLEDYFLFHIVLSALFELFPKYYDSIDKVCNSSPHILQLEMYKEYNAERLLQIFRLSSVHKLTYKINEEKIAPNSFWDRFIQNDKFEVLND